MLRNIFGSLNSDKCCWDIGIKMCKFNLNYKMIPYNLQMKCMHVVFYIKFIVTFQDFNASNYIHVIYQFA